MYLKTHIYVNTYKYKQTISDQNHKTLIYGKETSFKQRKKKKQHEKCLSNRMLTLIKAYCKFLLQYHILQLLINHRIITNP